MNVYQWICRTLRIDSSPRHRQPAVGRVILASIASIIGSLVADALIVAVGEALFPHTKGYVHFRFSDYGKLTVIGIVIACIAWPVVTRASWSPRWLFFRSAVLVTLVLWLPDLYILYRGQPGDAVGTLMVMHLAIALVTYNLLVRVAPVDDRLDAAPAPASTRVTDGQQPPPRTSLRDR